MRIHPTKISAQFYTRRVARADREGQGRYDALIPMGANPIGASNVYCWFPSLNVHDISRWFVSTSILRVILAHGDQVWEVQAENAERRQLPELTAG